MTEDWAKYREEFRQSESAQAEQRPSWLDLCAKVAQLPRESTRAIVRNLWREEEVLLLGGHSKSWKSWALMDLMFCIANGLGWLIWSEVVPGPVLHIDLELFASEIRNRYEMILDSYQSGSLDHIDVLSLRGLKFTLDDFSKLGDYLPPGKYSAILFDPTYRLLAGSGLSESDSGVIIDLMNRALQNARQLKAGFGLLQHFSKGSQTDKRAIDAFSGTGVWGRAPDACLTFREMEDERCYNVTADLRHWRPLEPFAVHFDSPRFFLEPDKDPDNLKIRRAGRPKIYSVEELCNLIESDEYVSYASLKRRSGKPDTSFKRWLGLAKAKGFISINPTDGSYFLTSPYVTKYRNNGQNH